MAFNDFLIELSVARRRDRLINARIRLAPGVYTLANLRTAQRRITKFMDATDAAFTPAAAFDGSVCEWSNEEESGSPIGTGCNNYYRISIRLSFASLHGEPPEEESSLYLVVERPGYANDSAISPTEPEYVTQSSPCTGCA